MNANYDDIPTELKELKQWVMWKLITRKGEKKPTKVPFTPRNTEAKSTDSKTWSSFEDCITALQTGLYQGIGFVFSYDDEYTGVDWDNVRDPETGVFDQEIHLEILSLASYAEISQSGKGAHVICKGKKPGKRCRSGCREMYSEDRFFVMTGDHLEGTPTTINYAPTGAIQAVYDKIDSKGEKASCQISSSKFVESPKLTDSEVIALCMGAKNANKFGAIWDGDTSFNGGDDSAADQALCDILAFYTQDPKQIDRLFRRSGLYRGKWEREDYRDRTVQNAIDGLTATYQPHRSSEMVGKTEKVAEDQYDVYPDHVVEAAHMILESGNALDFILDTWNHYHVGDRTIGESCACSVAATYILNSSGLHIKPSGKSGKGKSDSAEKFAKLLPTHNVYIGSMSGKAAYYNKTKPGTVFLLDDVNLNEDLITTIKTSTSNFQRPTAHRTVRKQDPLSLSIPERCVWWLTSVDGLDDEQMGNRFLGVDVDESVKQDEAVFQKQLQAELYGSPMDTDDILICRAIYDFLGQEQYIIRAPYMNCISWFNKANRRNFPMFMDILKCVTLYNIKQREKFCDCYLAQVEDFERAKKIYHGLAETNATNLTEKELQVIRWMSDPKRRGREIERKDIQALLGTSHMDVKRVMHGKEGNGGLLNKVCALDYHQVTVQYDGRSTKKYVYVYSGDLGLNSYTDVVSLDYSKIVDNIKAFKDHYAASSELDYTTYTRLNPGLTSHLLSDKSISIDNIDSTLNSEGNNVSHKAQPSKTSSSSNYNTHVSVKSVKSATDNESSLLSGVKPSLSVVPTPSQIDSVNKWLIDWERVYKQLINSQNYVAVAMEYAKGHKIPSDKLNDVLFAVRKYAKLAYPETNQNHAEVIL